MERIPRPTGLTEIANHQHKQEEYNIQPIHKHILEHYINTGFTYCNQPLNIEQLSHYIGIPSDTILEAITTKGQDIYHRADPHDQGDMLRALIGTALSASLADRSRAVQQLNILSAAQGNSYKAFISGEVNKALKLTMESTQGILALAKSLGGNQGLSLTINNDNSQTNIEAQQQNYLTTNQAVQLLHTNNNKASLLDMPEKKKELYAMHNIDDMPVVKANEQQGLDTSKEGLNFNKLVELSDSKVDQGPANHHEDRRAQEYEIDPEADQV